MKNPPQGYMINGKIDVTVANSDLTVAIKTLSGNNPSTSEPVLCTNWRHCSLYLLQLFPLQNDGTNWFNSGSSWTCKFISKSIILFILDITQQTELSLILRLPSARRWWFLCDTTTKDIVLSASQMLQAQILRKYRTFSRNPFRRCRIYLETVPTFYFY